MKIKSKINDMFLPISFIKNLVTQFRDERKWKRYHNPKDLAISISIEAGELLELFQWLSKKEVLLKCKVPKFKERVEEELADIIIYCFSLADVLKTNISETIVNKIKKNEEKYPVNKFKGHYYKY